MAQNKVILVTGASSGFGNLTVKLLVRNGHEVFAAMRDINGKNQEAARELAVAAQNTPGKLHLIEMDVTSDASVTRAFEQIEKKAKRLDVVVNNAGVMNIGVTEAYSVDEIKKQFEVNFFGPVRTARAALPIMRKQGAGLIVNVSSLAGRVVFPFFGAYCASKFALEAMAEAYRYELSQFGVDSIIVEPGPFGTSLLSNSPTPTNSEIVRSYGDTGKIAENLKGGFQAMYAAENPPRVAKVVEGIVTLIEMNGKRPLRTVIMPDGMDFGVEKLNSQVSEIQNALLKGMQLDHLA